MHQLQSRAYAPSDASGNNEVEIFSSTNSRTSGGVIKTFQQDIDIDDYPEAIRYRKVFITLFSSHW